MDAKTERERRRTAGTHPAQPRKPGEPYPTLKPLCTCGHDVEDHGDGVCHTACCAYLPDDTMCECTEYVAVADAE